MIQNVIIFMKHGPERAEESQRGQKCTIPTAVDVVASDTATRARNQPSYPIPTHETYQRRHFKVYYPDNTRREGREGRKMPNAQMYDGGGNVPRRTRASIGGSPSSHYRVRNHTNRLKWSSGCPFKTMGAANTTRTSLSGPNASSHSASAGS